MNQKAYPELDVLCVGMITSDVMLKPVDPGIFNVDKTHLTNLTYSVGGDAANQSVIFAKLGNRVGIAAPPGDDDAGVNVRRYLENYGIDTTAIVTMGEVTEYLSTVPHGGVLIIDDERKAAIAAYYEQYGVK